MCGADNHRPPGGLHGSPRAVTCCAWLTGGYSIAPQGTQLIETQHCGTIFMTFVPDTILVNQTAAAKDSWRYADDHHC